jgi:tetratricopeptide (TPR) repeat protein
MIKKNGDRISCVVFYCLFIFGCFSGGWVAQQTMIYTEEYRAYQDALELFDKEKYSAAQDKFKTTIESISNKQDEVRTNAEYFYAVCALELFHGDAEHLLNEFVFNHPDHPKAKKVYFQLGRYYYRNKRFKKVIDYFQKVDEFDLEAGEKIEYRFKYGYSLFDGKEMAKAKVHFHEVIQSENEYTVPGHYYYAHIAYTENNYQTALQSFEKIANDPMFESIVPYYIAQIYYKQEKYDQLISYAPGYLEKVSNNRKGEFAKLIGDAYYFKKEYKEAIPYLLMHRKNSTSTREDNYQLGYAYYQSGDYVNAADLFSRVVNKKDELSQIAYYQLGDAYLKANDKERARNAFKASSDLTGFDDEIRKNALFNYAKLAYELSDNPFNEAILAFETFINTYPKDAKVEECYEFLLKVYMTTKNYDAALTSLSKIKNKDDRMKMAYQSISFNRGVELFHNANYREAIENFKNVHSYPMDRQMNAESYYWMAEAYYRLNDYDRAISNFVEFKLEPGAALSAVYDNVDYSIGYAYFMKASPFEVINNYKDAILQQNMDMLNKSVIAFRSYITLKERVPQEKLLDTYLRIADCYYLLRQDKNAIEHYDIAIGLGRGDMSYAYYQKSRSQGSLGDNEGKARTLAELSSKFPGSAYQSMTLWDLAATYANLGENEKAITTYKEFILKYPKNTNVAAANSNTAGIYLRTKDYLNAKKYALIVLDNYPNDKVETEKALNIMKLVYEGQNDMPGYFKWLESRGIQVDNNERELTMYEPVKKAFDEGKCEAVRKNGEIYLKEISNGSSSINVNFYLAQCYYDLDKEKALAYYNFVIDKANNQHYEEALQFGAYLAFEKGDWPLAISHYNKLEMVASKESNVRSAVIAQLIAHQRLGNTENVINYAQKVLNLNNLEEANRIDALLYLGIAYKTKGDYANAKLELENCVKITQSIAGAEAKFHLSDMLFIQKEYSKCEKSIMELVKAKPSYDYWIAKGLILLGKVYKETGDYFNAKHTLNSVINNYNGKDKLEIINEAKAVIQEVNALEEQQNAPKSKQADELEFDLNDNDKKLFEGNQP